MPREERLTSQAPVVQTLDSAIQRLCIWETSCVIHWIEIYHTNFPYQTRMKSAKNGLDLKLMAKNPDSLEDLFALQNIKDLREIEYDVLT